MADNDEEYEIPLQDQRIFGAGIKRQRVKFVPSSSSTSTLKAPPSQSISDFYLGLVLSKEASKSTTQTAASPELSTREELEDVSESPKSQVCEICKLPLTSTGSTSVAESENSATTARPHEASLSHQVCLTHSYPPSHIDRKRKGLGILASYGWDPDSRLGLGASGQGIQFPIKATPKDDTLGLGLVLPKDIERLKKKKIEKLDAGKVRKMHEKDKKKAERLREMFYRNDDVERYLGGGGGG